ncbi:hypothetical protein [Paraburkholderia dipogonis]|uniref:hypothetical protein n=1 Tax=Paraburkholderia dipogonis TaxID=1211383 RepID=UPI0038BA0384
MSNTIHTTTLRGERRSVERLKKELIFDSVMQHYLTAGAVLHHVPDANEPGDALRWSLALAGLAYSDSASEEAWACGKPTTSPGARSGG